MAVKLWYAELYIWAFGIEVGLESNRTVWNIQYAIQMDKITTCTKFEETEYIAVSKLHCKKCGVCDIDASSCVRQLVDENGILLSCSSFLQNVLYRAGV